MTLSNSIVAGNTSASSANPDIASPSIRSNGSNVFGSDVSGGAAGDLENVPAGLLFTAVDPTNGGGQLADNGGSTQTIALRDAVDNPALADADPADSPVTDQRGVVRPAPAGTNPDIGAFELDQSVPPRAPTFLVTTTSDASADDGVLSMREALALADADPATADTIVFDLAAMGGNTIVLGGSQLTVASDVTIDGGSGVIIDGDEKSRVLLVQGYGTDVALENLTISGGRSSSDFPAGGGGIGAGSYTTLSLDQVSVTDNIAAGTFGQGGGIFSSGAVTLIHTTVSGNSAAGTYGGGGGIDAAEVTLINSVVSGNNTSGNGGGILTRRVTLTDSTVSGNTADGSGGGIDSTYATLTSSTVAGNAAAGSGGGLEGLVVTISNSTITDNSAAFRGGGINRDLLGILKIYSSTIVGNSTSGENQDGGGIYAGGGGGIVTLANSIVVGNSADLGNGGDFIGGILTSNGHNIFGSDVDGNASGDLEDVPASLLFAGGLADNGGPTQTIALRDAPDNPALGGADPATCPAPTSAARCGRSRPAPTRTSARSS